MKHSRMLNLLKLIVLIMGSSTLVVEAGSNSLTADKSHSTLYFDGNDSRSFTIRRVNNTVCFLRFVTEDNVPRELFVNGAEVPITYATRIPIYDDVINISSNESRSFILESHQEQCPVCAEISAFNFRFNEPLRNNCIVKFKKYSNRICSLNLNILNFAGYGFIEIDKERIRGEILGARTIPFTELLLIRNATINFSGKQKLCAFNTSLINPLVLSSLSGPSGPSECFDRTVYEERIITLISPEFPALSRPHNCLYEIRKLNPGICRLKLKFHYFWLGDGHDSVCRGGYLQVDGYRFCGCQSSLHWTTSIYTFRDETAFVKLVDEGRDGHFTSYLITIEQVQCSLRRAVNARYNTKRSLAQTNSLSIPRQPVVPRCPVPLVVVTPGGWRGSFASPEYPKSQSTHYLQRFQLNSAICGLEITFDDFDLLYTRVCTEEFITLGNSRRFCGQELVKNTLRMSGNEMWVSLQGVGRGFQASYRQIPCSEMQEEPDGKAKPNPPTTMCKHLYRQLIFTIQGPYTSSCTFIIRKTYPNICKLKLKLLNVNLKCGAQSLHVNGQYYCGRILEDNFELQFVNEMIEIGFNSFNGNDPAMFTIEGEQLACNLQEEQLRDECVVSLALSQGKVQSPALHPRPPEDLKCSYKFVPLKGICYIQLDFGEVLLPADTQCNKSYLSIDGVKYCGTSLTNSTKVLKLTPTKPSELPYMVDKNLNNIWWNFTYTQIPC